MRAYENRIPCLTKFSHAFSLQLTSVKSVRRDSCSKSITLVNYCVRESNEIEMSLIGVLLPNFLET